MLALMQADRAVRFRGARAVRSGADARLIDDPPVR
jgi:hypothetical protein